MGKRRILDKACFPLLAFLSPEFSKRISLTPIVEEKIIVCLELAEGRVLDIGCGSNEFIKKYGYGIGIDIYPWKGVDVLADGSEIPFKDEVFDTVTFIASLNHIPNRRAALREANRVLRREGKLLVTMLNPTVGFLSHKVRYIYDRDQTERGLKYGERWGLHQREIEKLFNTAGFRLISRRTFIWGLNNVYTGLKSKRSPTE